MPRPRRHANPLTSKRLRRFRQKRRAWCSLWLLVGLYVLSLAAELLCNDRPLYVRLEGRSYFPVFRYYPEDTFLQNQRYTRPDYKSIAQRALFADRPENRMIFAPVPFGPYESIDPESIPDSHLVFVELLPQPRVGHINIDRDFQISRPVNSGAFFDRPDAAVNGLRHTEHWKLPDALLHAVELRFDNRAAPTALFTATNRLDQQRTKTIRLTAYEPRSRPPRSVRLTLTEEQTPDATRQPLRFTYDDDGHPIESDTAGLERLSAGQIHRIGQLARRARDETHIREEWELDGRPYRVDVRSNTVQWPYRPVRGHWLGIDAAGRDVLARILYGLRTSMTFGLLLVLCTISFGTLFGAIQGYFAGRIDIFLQRFTEVWSALPFLYVMILIGAVYGRGFGVLLVCYALFNWIGISYYMRAEFLRLRNRAFVDAARCLGLPAPRIMFRHILPNALTPIITFFPFSLVGAIGALAALDFLGFGLPPPTPSWGELFQQAQTYRWAWWLILYPGLALFTVMLLCVFIGEGIRDAFDPKPDARIQ